MQVNEKSSNKANPDANKTKPKAPREVVVTTPPADNPRLSVDVTNFFQPNVEETGEDKKTDAVNQSGSKVTKADVDVVDEKYDPPPSDKEKVETPQTSSSSSGSFNLVELKERVSGSGNLKVVCISDTHNYHEVYLNEKFPIPDGDVLIHAGDFTERGTKPELVQFKAFLDKLPHKVKILIAGNHDTGPFKVLTRKNAYTYFPGCKFLSKSSSVTIDGVTFVGSGYNDRNKKIPDECHVFITHKPPHGILDVTRKYMAPKLTGRSKPDASSDGTIADDSTLLSSFGQQVATAARERAAKRAAKTDEPYKPPADEGEHNGCEHIRELVDEHKPLVHVFGHIHQGYGFTSNEHTTFINAAAVEGAWAKFSKIGNPPVVFYI